MVWIQLVDLSGQASPARLIDPPGRCMPRILVVGDRVFQYDNTVWSRNSYSPAELYRYRELPATQVMRLEERDGD